MMSESESLRERALYYEANDQTKSKLGRFVLTSLIGPPESGKLTLALGAVERVNLHKMERWSLAHTLTTRDRNYGLFGDPDPDAPTFQTADEGVTYSNLVRRINAGEVVGYSVRQDGTIYAIGAQGFVSTYNILPSMPASIPAISRAGFERTESIFLTMDVGQWHKRLERQYPKDWQEDAIENLEFAESQADTLHFVHNSGDRGGKEMAISEVIDITLGLPRADDRRTGLHVVQAMLKYAKRHVVDN